MRTASTSPSSRSGTSQAGTPTITVTHRYEPEKERLTLELKQDLPETPDRLPKLPMHIPVAFGLVGPDGQDLSFSKASGDVVRTA